MMSKYRMSSGFAMMPKRDMKMLQRISKKGWHLAGMKNVLYRFEKGEPHTYIYALNLEMDFDDEMLSFYTESGWKPIVIGEGYQIFRAEAGSTPIFSDVDSELDVINRNRAVCGKLTFVSTLLLVAALICSNKFENPILFVPLLICYAFWVITAFPFIGFSVSAFRLKKKSKANNKS